MKFLLRVRRVIGFILAFLTFVVFALFLLGSEVLQTSTPSFFEGCEKIWSHRGIAHSGEPENTIRSVQSTLNLGVKGVELDIIYDSQQQVFWLSHDQPKEKDLLLGRLDQLESLFKQVEKGYFWLDLKGLRNPTQETFEGVKVLAQKIKKYGKEAKVIVESRSPWTLFLLRHYGILTSLWVEFDPDLKPDWIQRFYVRLLKGVIFLIQPARLSFDYKDWVPSAHLFFKTYKVHIFTVDDREVMKKLLTESNTSVILSNNPVLFLKGLCP